MLGRVVLSAALAFAVTPVFAGPCTERIAQLEKSVVAKHEGAGPALAAPGTTGSTLQSSAPAEGKGDNDTMQLLQQAKQLDQQGKESECMATVTRIGAMAPAQTK
jgi:hypothetical protein